MNLRHFYHSFRNSLSSTKFINMVLISMSLNTKRDRKKKRFVAPCAANLLYVHSFNSAPEREKNNCSRLKISVPVFPFLSL